MRDIIIRPNGFGVAPSGFDGEYSIQSIQRLLSGFEIGAPIISQISIEWSMEATDAPLPLGIKLNGSASGLFSASVDSGSNPKNAINWLGREREGGFFLYGLLGTAPYECLLYQTTTAGSYEFTYTQDETDTSEGGSVTCPDTLFLRLDRESVSLFVPSFNKSESELLDFWAPSEFFVDYPTQPWTFARSGLFETQSKTVEFAAGPDDEGTISQTFSITCQP
jgi:hypothetical protein